MTSFSVERDLLVAALARAGKAISKSAVTPGGRCCRVTAEAERLVIEATDLAVAVQCRVPAMVRAQGAFAVVPADLGEKVKRMPPGSVRIAQESNRINITTPGRKRGFVLAVLPEDEAPRVRKADGPGVRVDGKTLAEALSRALVCASTDETRTCVYGVCVDKVGGHIGLIATDSHRLAAIDTDVAALACDPTILHRRAAEIVAVELPGMKEPEVAWCGQEKPGALVVRDASTTIIASEVAAVFPPWREFMPKDIDSLPIAMTVSRSEMLEAVQAMLAVHGNGSDKSPSLFLEALPSGLSLRRSGSDDKGEDVVDAEMSGMTSRLAYAVEYFADLLKIARSERLTLRCSEPLAPLVARDGSDILLVMPRHLDGG
jgi:DNA polymerase III subunit beta